MQKFLGSALEFQSHLAALLLLINTIDNQTKILLCCVDTVCLHDSIGIGERGRLRCCHKQHLVCRKDEIHNVAPKPRARINDNQIGTCSTVGKFLLQEDFLCMVILESLLNARASRDVLNAVWGLDNDVIQLHFGLQKVKQVLARRGAE